MPAPCPGGDERRQRGEQPRVYAVTDEQGVDRCPPGARATARRAEFRFDSIELNPKLKASDFVFKRGLFK